jgi:hypothetical protein
VSAVEFLPERAQVSAPAAVVEWIVAGAAEAPHDPDLIASGVLEDGELHPRLQAIRDAVAGAPVHLLLERGDRRGRGWLGPAGAVVAHPLPDGRMRLLMLPAALLVDALVRLNDVGPRPRARTAPRLSVAPGELAQALATRDAAAVRLEAPERAQAFSDLIAGLREHWRIATQWEAADGEPRGRDLEVLDTEDGYWLVVPDDPTVELWPVTPSAVFGGLCDLFPPAAEVSGWAPR